MALGPDPFARGTGVSARLGTGKLLMLTIGKDVALRVNTREMITMARFPRNHLLTKVVYRLAWMAAAPFQTAPFCSCLFEQAMATSAYPLAGASPTARPPTHFIHLHHPSDAKRGLLKRASPDARLPQKHRRQRGHSSAVFLVGSTGREVMAFLRLGKRRECCCGRRAHGGICSGRSSHGDKHDRGEQRSLEFGIEDALARVNPPASLREINISLHDFSLA